MGGWSDHHLRDILGMIQSYAAFTGDRRSKKGLGFAGGRAGSDSSGATEAAGWWSCISPVFVVKWIQIWRVYIFEKGLGWNHLVYL